MLNGPEFRDVERAVKGDAARIAVRRGYAVTCRITFHATLGRGRDGPASREPGVTAIVTL